MPREVARGTAGYESARRAVVWNARTPPRFPDAIATPRDQRQVVEAIATARERGMKVSLASGGHSWPGVQLRDGAMLVDLSRLAAVEVDVQRRTASVGPGVRGAQLEAALGEHRLGFPFGHAPTVAVGGFLLAGGLGWNPGTWGPACHSVSAVDVVLPTGESVTADERHRPDILWAARGAGPAFPGVVTRFQLALRGLPRAIATSTLVFPLAALEPVGDWVSRLTDTLSPNVELAVRVARLPHGERQVGIRVTATAFADSPREAEAALAPVHDCPRRRPPLAEDRVVPTSLRELHGFVSNLFPVRHRYAAEALWSDTDPSALLSTLASHIEQAPSPLSFGTAVIWPSTAPRGREVDAAFSRLGRTFATCYAIWPDEREDRSNLAWHERAGADLAAAATGYYIGETDVLDRRRARRSFTEAAARRIERLRAEVDLAGLLHSIL